VGYGYFNALHGHNKMKIIDWIKMPDAPQVEIKPLFVEEAWRSKDMLEARFQVRNNLASYWYIFQWDVNATWYIVVEINAKSYKIAVEPTTQSLVWWTSSWGWWGWGGGWGTTWGSITWTLSAQSDLQAALNAKVPTTRTITINWVTQDLSADRTWTVSWSVAWGAITGTLSDQTDLQAVLDTKLEETNEFLWVSILWWSTVITTWRKWLKRCHTDWNIVWYRIDSYDMSWWAIVWSITFTVKKNWTTIWSAILSASDTVYDTTLTWRTLGIAKEDKIEFEVASVTSITNATLTIYFTT